MNLLADLKLWDAASDSDRKSAIHSIVSRLPEGFAFEQIGKYSLGDQTHEIATFTYEQCRFALVPGDPEASLGYDRSHPFKPTAAQFEDWKINEAEYESLESFLDHYLSQLRTVAIMPLLIEVVATSTEYAQDGSDQHEGYQRVVESCAMGFRLPTVDEWEYTCAAGTRTLFRWGTETPQSSSGSERDWDFHRSPNAFGVRLNSSTYHSEICAGPILRGGDGGGFVHGGIGNFITWLPFASAFQVPQDEVDYWWIDNVYVRRVFEVELESS